MFGPTTPFYGWHYPPFFLFVAAPLALLPYPLALAVWQGVTFALYLWMIFAVLAACSRDPLEGGESAPDWIRGRSPERSESDRIGVAGDTLAGPPPGSLRDPTSPLQGEVSDSRAVYGSSLGLCLLLAVAYPAVFVNLGHGHNGFLTAALMGGALVLLNRRPWLAGVLFGLLAYKPQFGLMIPLVLLVSGRWRTIAAAAATVVALCALTTWTFGVDVWSAFLTSTRLTRVVVLEHGDTGWYKIQSVFSWVRMWGGSISLAYTLQAIATVLVATALAWLWRSRIAFPFKAAALALAAVLATPYSLDYDLMVLAPAIAFLGAHGLAYGFGPYERTLLGILWLVPLVARAFAEWTLIPLAVPAMLLTFFAIMRRAAAESGIGVGWRFASGPLR
jgi:hypothetical protein